MRELISAAKNMDCRHPATTTARIVEVTLERARCLPRDIDSSLPPDTYVSIVLEGIEAKSQVNVGYDPNYNERVRLYVPDSQMRKDELAVVRDKFETVCEASAIAKRLLEQQEQNEGNGKAEGIEDAASQMQHSTNEPHRLMPADLHFMFGDTNVGGEEDVKALMEENDVNHSGYLEWEEFVRLYENVVPRPTNLDLHIMRVREGEEDKIIGSVYLSLDDIDTGKLIVQPILDENDSEMIGNGDKLACLSLRVRVFHLSSETGVSPDDDPATHSLTVLLHSSRVRRDLQYCKTMGCDKYPATLMLRQFDPEIVQNPERHFRVFVCDNQITAISQRHHELYFYKLHIGSTVREYKEQIVNFFWTCIATRMRDKAYMKYVFDVFVHVPKATSIYDQASLPTRVSLLGFSPFAHVTDACLYSWSVNNDTGILTMGRVFPPSSDPQRQPTLILPSGQVVPNVDIRVRDKPVQEPLRSLPSVWQKRARKLIEKLQAEAKNDGRVHEEKVEAHIEGKVSFTCNPAGIIQFLSPSSFFSTGWGLKNENRCVDALMKYNFNAHSSHQPPTFLPPRG